ncbi:hypothetical protein RJT34_15762 [Clitoria ternatea]|uniref:Uncharacterized protein n=1 Tax=Clitoria ternatea TaxID=43366 RepID=A0AAN9J7G9_CLITE
MICTPRRERTPLLFNNYSQRRTIGDRGGVISFIIGIGSCNDLVAVPEIGDANSLEVSGGSMGLPALLTFWRLGEGEEEDEGLSSKMRDDRICKKDGRRMVNDVV